jgi:hypothetical protein
MRNCYNWKILSLNIAATPVIVNLQQKKSKIQCNKLKSKSNINPHSIKFSFKSSLINLIKKEVLNSHRVAKQYNKIYQEKRQLEMIAC